MKKGASASMRETHVECQNSLSLSSCSPALKDRFESAELGFKSSVLSATGQMGNSMVKRVDLDCIDEIDEG